MQIEPLNFSHQRLLSSRLSKLNLGLSEHSFSNLYLFKKIHQYTLICIDDLVLIKGITRDKTPFIMPTAHPDENLYSALSHLILSPLILFPIPDEWLNCFSKRVVHSYYKEEDSDYIFAQKKIASYPGRHLDGKRNQVKQLLSQHEVMSEKFSHQIDDALYILDSWEKDNRERTQTDYSSCKEALLHFDSLNLKGCIVYVDKKPAGFILGEWSSKDYFSVHFSKGMRTIKGIYQYLFQEMAKSVEENCTWINLEQDLGIPSLRASKLSYHPDLIKHKWRVELK